MTQAPRRTPALSAALAVAVALVAFATLPTLVAALASLTLALGAVGEAWGARERARELASVDAYAALSRVEADRLVSPDVAPVVRAQEARAVLARVHAAARRVQEAAAQAREQARAHERSQAVRARFTAAMGHELKTPLGSIVGFSTALERRPAEELCAAQRESVAMIRRGAEDLLRLLTDLLDSAKLDVGQLTLGLAWVPSVEVLTQAVKEARAIVEGRSVTIDSTFQPGMPPIRVDRARLVQAIVGVFRHIARGLDRGVLVLGARRAQGPHGRSELHVEIRDPQRALGPGEVERIFEAFRAVRAPGGGRPGGLGLALSLARRLVRLHGGDIAAEADEEGGTRLVVSVPIDE